jgi:hypothetical protein
VSREDRRRDLHGTVRRPRRDRELSGRRLPANADRNVWRGPCGGWHYGQDPCATCDAAERLAGEL